MVRGLNNCPDISGVIFDVFFIVLWTFINVVAVRFAQRIFNLINSIVISHAKRRVLFVCFICGVVRGKSGSNAG